MDRGVVQMTLNRLQTINIAVNLVVIARKSFESAKNVMNMNTFIVTIEILNSLSSGI